MIPSILWQTWKTKDIPGSVKKQADSWKISNPQLQIKFMDDDQCSNFILEHFGKDIHEQYHLLPLPIMRADFWRLAVVYIHGGYYSDLDITCNQNISSFINPNVEAVWMRELNNISNYFFGAKPNHPIIKKAMDNMLFECQFINDKEAISWGMHGLHTSVREYYNVNETNYISNDEVQFILDSDVRNKNVLIHSGASIAGGSDYTSWRSMEKYMQEQRKNSNNIIFFTTFNKSGYELYGKTWIKTFIKLSNYYNKFHAKIYYEGFTPVEKHSNIHWIDYDKAIPNHKFWKRKYLDKTTHAEYVKTMTVRFSHKGMVIQHMLENNNDDYLIWLDGDCIFKQDIYGDWPKNVLGDKFLACQMEYANDLNHIESGILIFNGKHPDTKKWNEKFKQNYSVEEVLPMGEPYDGFIIYRTLLMTSLPFVNLNENLGGGIQSDPNLTFLNPEIKDKFKHNIGWTGKHQYESWDIIRETDGIYKKMRAMLFGSDIDKQKKREEAYSKLERMKRMR